MERKKNPNNIKEIAKKYKERNGNERITNKELLWFMISEFDGLKTRVTKTETKQKVFMWAIPVCVTVVALVARSI